jgi:outer membrane protein TolC
VRVEQEAMQTARDRYTTGLASLSDVLNSESELSAAEFNRVRIFYQLHIANTDLAFASGSPLTSKAGQP